MSSATEGRIVSDSNAQKRSDLNIFLMLVLSFFLGVFGAHRFYAQRYLSAIIQLLTLGGLGIWALVDFIIIAFGEFKDSYGYKVRYP
ncbi:TM2 domain-containing protein [Microbulbifer agarilyticus]|nr:TM2 domain-containing protein [Microbulbifer agarilyticus]